MRRLPIFFTVAEEGVRVGGVGVDQDMRGFAATWLGHEESSSSRSWSSSARLAGLLVLLW